MLHTQNTTSPTHHPASYSSDQFLAVLDNTEAGMAVVNTLGQTVYLNSSLQSMMATNTPSLPEWCLSELLQMIERIRSSSEQVVEKWCHEGTTFRVRGRSLSAWSGHIALEVSVAYSNNSASVADVLSRGLALSRTDAALLELLWRGMSNEEIATQQRVRLGTVKSRLFRLYQKLGVRRRPAAVLRAAEVIAV